MSLFKIVRRIHITTILQAKKILVREAVFGLYRIHDFTITVNLDHVTSPEEEDNLVKTEIEKHLPNNYKVTWLELQQYGPTLTALYKKESCEIPLSNKIV